MRYDPRWVNALKSNLRRRAARREILARWPDECRKVRARIKENIKVDLRPVPHAGAQEYLDKRLEAFGIRKFPYPFSSALTITSDTDCTTRLRYSLYIKELVDVRGLDFGDSCWLAAQASEHTPAAERGGFGLLSPDLRIDPEFSARERVDTLDFHELLREFHRGNIDHLHSLTPRGPRVIILRNVVKSGARRFSVTPPENVETSDWYQRANGFPVLGVGVWVRSGAEAAVEKVEAVDKSGVTHEFSEASSSVRPRFFRDGFPEGRQIFFARTYGLYDRTETPDFNDLRSIRIHLSTDDSRAAPWQVYLYNQYTKILLDRMTVLRDKFHFSPNLLTMHGVWHFYTHFRLQREITRNSTKLRPVCADGVSVYGAFDTEGFRFSTVADDPDSFVEIASALFGNGGVRFVRMTQGRKYPARSLRGEKDVDEHCDICDLVYPIASRSGQLFYNFCAAFPEISAQQGDLGEAGRVSRANTFDTRLVKILQQLSSVPGRCAAFYTHLGHWGIDGDQVPEFGNGALAIVEDRYYNKSGTVPRGRRVWFTRASILANYAFLLQNVAGLMQSRGRNSVRLRQLACTITDERLCVHSSQLFGMTFFVDSARAARVFVGEEEISDLVRNGPDDTGRESVTIADCGIRSVVFDEIDPKLRGIASGESTQWTESGAAWRWMDKSNKAARGRAFARIFGGKTDASEVARISMRGSWVESRAAQFFMYWIRKAERSTKVGWLLETGSRGRFFFGDCELTEFAGRLDASYLVNRSGFANARRWERVVVPFYDLTWNEGETVDGVLPAHELQRLTLLIGGHAGWTVDLDAVEFGRPRVDSANRQMGTSVLGGRIWPKAEGVLIRFRRVGSEEVCYARTDGLGGFAIKVSAPGGYEVSGPEDVRPVLAEVYSDRMDLVLRAARTEENDAKEFDSES